MTPAHFQTSAYHSRCARGHVTTDGTFRCDACMRRRRKAVRHPSGFCVDCIDRYRRWWLSRFSPGELAVLAACLWPELEPPLRAAA